MMIMWPPQHWQQRHGSGPLLPGAFRGQQTDGLSIAKPITVSARSRRSSSVPRSGNNSTNGDVEKSTKPQVFIQGQALIRGASTMIIPKSVWTVRVRLSRCRRSFMHSGQTRAHVVYSSICVCSTRRPSSPSSSLRSASVRPTSSAVSRYAGHQAVCDGLISAVAGLMVSFSVKPGLKSVTTT